MLNAKTRELLERELANEQETLASYKASLGTAERDLYEAQDNFDAWISLVSSVQEKIDAYTEVLNVTEEAQ